MINVTEKCVQLYDQTGNLLVDSSEKGVHLKNPRGIAYSGRESALIVADYKAGILVVLHEQTLQQIRTVKISGITQPFGVAILDNDLVVTHRVNGSVKVGVYSKNGKTIRFWECLRDDRRKFPSHVAIGAQNEVIVTALDGIICYNKDGGLIRRIRTGRFPYGCLATADDILVAGCF